MEDDKTLGTIADAVRFGFNVMLAVMLIVLIVLSIKLGNLHDVLVSVNEPTPGVFTTESEAFLSSTSTVAAGPQEVKTAFSENPGCASRVVSTKGDAVMLLFGGENPTGTNGFLQAASTTVSYPSSEFGCEQVKIFSFSSTSPTLAEFNR